MNLELIKKEAAKFFPADATLSLGGAISFAKHCVEKSQPRLTMALEIAAIRTRDDLGPTGSNYPDVRTLLAFAEQAIESNKPLPPAPEAA